MNSKIFNSIRRTLVKKSVAIRSLIAATSLASASFANAALLSNADIEADFRNNPLFQRTTNNASHLYAAPDYAEAATPVAENLATFFERLRTTGFKERLGQPAFIPVGVGDITTFIPVHQHGTLIGTPFVQSRYIREQVRLLLGRNLINTADTRYASEAAQLNSLYNQTLAYLRNENSTVQFGQSLNLNQNGSGLADDIVWPEYRIINGVRVLVPIVYLSQGTVNTQQVTGHFIELNGAVSVNNLVINDVSVRLGRNAFLDVAGSLLNNRGIIQGLGDLQVLVRGALNNLSGIIQAQGNLNIGAHSVSNQTIVHRYDFGSEQSGSFGQIAQINSTTGDVTLRTYNDILVQGGIVDAPQGNITFNAGGNIYIGPQQYMEGSQTSGRRWNRQRSSTETLISEFTAGDSIKLMAAGAITIDAANLHADKGHIELLAGYGISVIDSVNTTQSSYHYKSSSRTIDENSYITVAVRSVLDAGKGIIIHSDKGDITLRATDIRSADGTRVNAANGAVNMLMTVENDHYSYNSVKESTWTIKSVQRGHNHETAVPNTIIGGFQAEALYGVAVQYEGDPNLSLDEQIAALAAMPGMEWMQTVRNDPNLNIDWSVVDLVYEEWNRKKTTLSPAAMAVIAIAVAVAMPGAGPGIVNGMLTAATNSIVTIAATATANAAVDGNNLFQSLEAGYEAVFEKDAAQQIATAMVTAAAISYIDTEFFSVDPSTIEAAEEAARIDAIARGLSSVETAAVVNVARASAAQLSLGMQAAQFLTNATVQTTAQHLVYGGDFELLRDGFMTNLAQQGVNLLGQYMASSIGNAFDVENPTAMETALKYISHAGAGCIVGAASSEINRQTDTENGCVSGAGGAVVGEYIGSVARSRDEVEHAQDEIKLFIKENEEYVGDLYRRGFSTQEISEVLNLTTDIPYYAARLDHLAAQGVDIARFGAAIGAFAAGADAAGVNIASNTGAITAENNALFLVFAVPAILTSIDVIMTGMELLEIYDAFERGDTAEGNRLLALWGVETAVGQFIPGDKLLASIVEYAAKNGKNLGKRADSIVAWVENRIEPRSARIDGIDEGVSVTALPSNGGRGGMTNELNAPLTPSHVYHVDGKYRYETDANGNVSGVSGELQLAPGSRSCYQQRLAAGCGLSTDEGGHLIGSQFGGPAERINLVPQDWELNRGAGSPWREMEESWARALEEGLPVTVNMRLEYPSGSQRPDKFIVEYTIDGDLLRREFFNQAGG